MAATSRGEFHFIRGCFIAVACGTIGAHLWWQWTNEAALTGWRVAIGGLVGAVTVAGLVLALDWVKRKEAAAIPPKAEESSGELLLECQQAVLPTVGLPRQNSLTVVSPFRFEKEGTIGISGVVTEPGQPINLPEEWKGKTASSARCRLTNYGKTPLFNVEIPIRISFRRIKRGDGPGSAIGDEIINVAEIQLPITKIEPGSDAAYTFYIHNQGRDVVEPHFPDTANHLPPGAGTRRPLTLIQSASATYRYIALWPVRSTEDILAEEEKAKTSK
jgi:hypothetical protein